MSTRRIWIDMTDMASWSGHLTGIQRVMYLNAIRFADSPEYDTHFFVFKDAHRIFVEVDFGEIRAQIEADPDANEDPEATVRRSTKQLLRAVPRALVRRIPESVKRRVPPEVKQGLRGGYRLSVSMLRKSKRALSRRVAPVVPSNLVPLVFDANDTVLILGKSWDLPDLIPTLGQLKLSQHFTFIHLIHDMIPTVQPHCFGWGLYEPYTKTMFEVCSLADGIMAQSKATAQDVRAFCDSLLIPRPVIKTVRLGDEILDFDLTHVKSPDKRIVSGKFILEVGNVEVRKNHLLTYLAYREAALRGIDLPVWVIIGSQGWLVGDLLWQIEHDPVVKDKIMYLGGVSDRTKLWLFRNCRFTIYPSTYEGWGMPVSESLAYGKPVITSKTSSLPEAGNGVAQLVSPYNTEEMLQAIVHYMDDKNLRAAEAKIKDFKPATWDEMFQQVTSFIDQLQK